jgi:hypothetical protein
MRVRPALPIRNPRLTHGLVIAAMVACTAPLAMAQDIRLNLSGANEVPPVSTAAMASGVISVNPDMTVAGSITTTGVAATMAHIHQGAVAKNGPVLIGLVKEGDNVWRVPAGARFTEEQYRAFKAGELYVNVHSAEHKGGEVRAQLTATPMPATPATTGGY